jgi:hypothetical protein
LRIGKKTNCTVLIDARKKAHQTLTTHKGKTILRQRVPAAIIRSHTIQEDTMHAFQQLLRFAGFAGISIAMFLSGFSCTDNPLGNDDSDGQIDDCSLDGAITYDSAGGPYTFTCNRVYINGSVTIAAGTQATIKGYFDITQTGTLTIEQGARLLMDEGSYLWVNGGKLNINGTQARPVQIRNNESGKFWGPDDPAFGGICFENDANQQSSITWCHIDSATNGISSDKDGLSITNTTVRYSKLNGMVFYQCGPKDSASFCGNTFIHNGSAAQYYPLVINAPFLVRLSGSGTFTDNANEAIRVACTNTSDYADESGTWRRHAVPYVFTDGYVAVGNSDGVAITIQPGTRLLFTEDAYIWIDKGKLTAEGTASDSIFFKNAEPGKFWGSTDPAYGGITFTGSANATSSLAYCVFDSAKNAVSVDCDKMSITHSTVRNAQHNGIIFYESGPADSAHFIGNAFIKNGSGNSDYPLVIDAANLTRLPGDGVFTANSQQAINVHCQGSSNQVTESGTWRKHAVPYVFSNSYADLENSSGVTITIEPGTRLLFQADAYIYTGRGTLIARGTATDSIIFENQTAGERWGFEGGLQFSENSPTNSAIQYCRISFAKDNGIFLDIQPVTISKCTINDSKEYGIYMNMASASANVDLSSISFSNNGTGEYLIDD